MRTGARRGWSMLELLSLRQTFSTRTSTRRATRIRDSRLRGQPDPNPPAAVRGLFFLVGFSSGAAALWITELMETVSRIFPRSSHQCVPLCKG